MTTADATYDSNAGDCEADTSRYADGPSPPKEPQPSSLPRPPLAITLDHRRRSVTVRSDFLGSEKSTTRSHFLKQVFASPHVESVELRTHESIAIIHCQSSVAGSPRFESVVAELAAAVRGDGLHGVAFLLPYDACSGTNVCIRRYGNRLTTWTVVCERADQFRLQHARLRRNRLFGRSIERLVVTMPGIREARLGLWNGDLVIRIDPMRFDADALLAVLQHAVEEEALDSSPYSPLAMCGKTASLGVAALADFVLPTLSPLSAVLLVGTNLRTLSSAATEIKGRHIGLSTMFAAIIIGALATGQFMASAVMAWSFEFWRHRHRRDMEVERRLLLEDAAPLPACSALESLDGTCHMQPLYTLAAGDRVRFGAYDVVPVDGRVIEGDGVIDERFVRGVNGVRTVHVGESLLAGTLVLGGDLLVAVERGVEATRLASIGRAIRMATQPQPGRYAATAHGDQFAEGFVVPTLATAGFGLLTGGVGTAVAILRPDYGNAEALSLSLEDIDAVAWCLALGCVLRTPHAPDALESIDTLVLVDSPGLHRRRTVLTAINGPADANREMLRWGASLARHLADERCEALADSARLEGCALIDLIPDSFGDAAGLAIVCRQSKRTLVLREGAAAAEPSLRTLVLEIDGMIAAHFEFARSPALAATAAIDRLHSIASIRTILFADDALRLDHLQSTDVATLADELHAEAGGHATDPKELALSIQQLRASGRRVAIAGRCRNFPWAVAAAHVAIDTEAGIDIDTTPAGIILLKGDLAVLGELLLAARQRRARILTSRKLSILPNLACVGGAFLLGFTSLISAIVCNVFTVGVYARSTANLHAHRRSQWLRNRTPGLLHKASVRRNLLAPRARDRESIEGSVLDGNKGKPPRWEAVSP
ncbi:MAG: hypothetical protein NTY87_01195 [Planctomycetia bacterium]|nr:hypothetical protein [Planctomycetia bacterium]